MPKRKAWPGWAAAVDEELAAAGGALPWRRLKASVAARFAEEVEAHTGEDPGIMALAHVPEAYLSREDAFVRLPAVSGLRGGRRGAAGADGAAAASSWPGWRPACDEALAVAGGALAWRPLAKAAVAAYHSDRGRPQRRLHRRGARAQEDLLACALASLPDEYLSREDEYVRLPARAPPPPAGPPAGVVCEGGRCYLPRAAPHGVAACPAASAPAQRRPEADEAASSSEAPSEEAEASGGDALVVCEDEAAFEGALAEAGAGLVVADFTAAWCAACQRLRPELRDLADEMPEVRFLEVDVDANAAVANRFRVTSMPTFLFFKAAKCIGTYGGANIDELTLHVVDLK